MIGRGLEGVSGLEPGRFFLMMTQDDGGAGIQYDDARGQSYLR
jgi:hypothetical protein